MGADNQLTNASDRPANPAIRAEIIGPSGRQTKIAFAKFPDFSSMHGAQGADEVKMTFVATGAIAESSPPVEIFATLDGKLLAVQSARWTGDGSVDHPRLAGRNALAADGVDRFTKLRSRKGATDGPAGDPRPRPARSGDVGSHGVRRGRQRTMGAQARDQTRHDRRHAV